MDYCTIADIEKQISTQTLAQLTNDEGGADVDAVVAEEAIIYASVLINGYLRGRYTLPLNTHFPLLRILAIDLAIYRLYNRRMHTDLPASIQEQYKNTIKTLSDLQKGIITLDNAVTDEPLKSGQYLSNKSPRDRDFSKQVLKGF